MKKVTSLFVSILLTITTISANEIKFSTETSATINSANNLVVLKGSWGTSGSSEGYGFRNVYYNSAVIHC